MYQIIQKRKIWLSFSGLLVILSIAALAVWGLNFGIDFTGGALLEVEYTEERPTVVDVQAVLGDLELGSLIVQPIGEKGMIFRFRDTSEEKHQAVLEKLTKMLKIEEDNVIEIDSETQELVLDIDQMNKTVLEELRYDSVGPTIGAELKTKSLYAAIIVLVAIVLYIAWTFRKVSKPVASWKYGMSATIALFHDVIITIGVFAFLGEFYGVEIDTPFVAAILTVLGYSVNDTIVVFDRIRENLPRSNEDFENTVNTSVNQTIQRSINTSFTTLLVLLSILFWGGASIRGFVLALSIGVFIGTYSSIFLASPVLVIWEKLKR